MPDKFFQKINYSASNEDSESERIALQINPNDTVLCITGSGARTLDLLIDSPKQIVSIDFNAAQNFLLELKIAGFKTLSYDELLKFLGIRPCFDRMETYQKLMLYLSKEALAFWNSNQKHIKNGVIYCGTWEKLLKRLSLLAFFRKPTIEQFMNADSISAQKETWDKKWNNRTWRWFLKFSSNRFLWTKIIREPGAKIIPKDFSVYHYMKSRLEHMSACFQMKSNHYANLIFTGRYSRNCILPHHLREENFELIQENLDRIEIVTDSLLDYLPQQENRFSKFSLSDFSSYAPLPVYHSIWENVLFSAQPGALFCERNFLVKRNPEVQFEKLRRNKTLEKELLESDESFIYTFCVGEISFK